jgi:hypothetical protein
LHVRSSHDQVAGDLLERQALHQRHFQGSTYSGTVYEIILPRRRANKTRWSCCGILPTSRVISILWRPGALQGVSGARHGLKHDGRPVQDREEMGVKGRRELLEKVAENVCVFIS